MNTKSEALQWLDANRGPVHASKLYSPEEAATRDVAWWFRIPRRELDANVELHVNLLCQQSAESHAFHWLRVPVEFLLAHESDFSVSEDGTWNFILDATEERMFQDRRGPGKCEFKLFIAQLAPTKPCTVRAGAARP